MWSFVAADAGARLALARRLVDLDLMGETELWLTPEDPLVLWLPSPRVLGGGGLTDNLWLRVVDLPGAVAGRGHACDLDVVVEVRDAVVPDQAGRWRWTAREGVGELSRTDEAPAVTLDIGDLGAVWLGGATNAPPPPPGALTGGPAAVAALHAGPPPPPAPPRAPPL